MYKNARWQSRSQEGRVISKGVLFRLQTRRVSILEGKYLFGTILALSVFKKMKVKCPWYHELSKDFVSLQPMSYVFDDFPHLGNANLVRTIDSNTNEERRKEKSEGKAFGSLAGRERRAVRGSFPRWRAKSQTYSTRSWDKEKQFHSHIIFKIYLSVYLTLNRCISVWVCNSSSIYLQQNI